MHKLLAELKDWSGTADDVATEAARILAPTALEAPTSRSFRNYVVRNCVQPAGDKRTFSRRQVLEAVSVRILLADGWPLERIADHNRGASDADLASLIELFLARSKNAPVRKGGTPASDLVKRFKSGVASAPAPVAKHLVAQPMHRILRSSLLSPMAAAQPAVAMAFAAQSSFDQPAPPAPPAPDAPRRADLVSYQAGGVTLAVDRNALPQDPDQLAEAIDALKNAAIAELFQKG